MMKSLWAGVSGLQAHQVALDVEGNNIANVNTPGFKYSRANFSDLLSQTIKIATSPQDSSGGTNEAQVGLGGKIGSTTRIFRQGSSVATDKLTDVSIQGNGFFMVTNNSGSSYQYTRNGDFFFDSAGNFVDQRGYKVQGWVKDLNPNTSTVDITSSKVDTTSPVANIKIEPALRIPANKTSKIVIKANLNSGSLINNKKAVFSSDGKDGYLYNRIIAQVAMTPKPTAGISERELYYTGPKKGQITNHNDKGFRTGTDMLVTANANGKFFNLQTSTSDPANLKAGAKKEINGQGVVMSVVDTSVPPKTFNYEFRYTDKDTAKNHPSVSQINPKDGTITQNVTHNVPLASNTYVFQNDQSKTPKPTKVIYFNTDQELRIFMQSLVRDPGQDGTKEFDAKITMNHAGKYVLENNNPLIGDSLNVSFEAITDDHTTKNVLFAQMLSPISGVLDPEQRRLTESVSSPSHATSINVYDSLGSRYSLRVEFQKISSSEWSWRASVPKPASLVGGVAPDENILRGGIVSFTKNGALRSYSPPNIVFNSNRGSEGGQIVQIDFGNLNGYGGLTHLDKPSSTSGIKQDGFSGGTLVGTRIDESGTVIGNFSNDRAFALAKLAVASFTNNLGLSGTGGNSFSETSNSGKPIIGVALEGGKGSIDSSRLEASNVDLTKALTQLIVVQRGFQANSKTVTTSDQILNTLLQMKQ